MTKEVKPLTGAAESVLVYLATLGGVLAAQVVPLLHSGQFTLSIIGGVKLIGAALIALVIIANDEKKGEPIGKSARFKRRLSVAFTHGYTANSILSGMAS